MKKFDTLQGIAAALPTANIDTDQIIPKQFLKTIERKGLARGLFYDFRFAQDGTALEEFVLSRPPFNTARILVAGDNFGCGSSREHAPWALMDFGIDCVISSSFADIFYNNSLQNGLLPAIVSTQDLALLLAEANGGTFRVSLPEQTIVAPSGAVVPFSIDAARKAKLLKGLDAIGETLEMSDAITMYERARLVRSPWLERPVHV